MAAAAAQRKIKGPDAFACSAALLTKRAYSVRFSAATVELPLESSRGKAPRNTMQATPSTTAWVTPASAATRDIVDIAASAGNFATLSNAIKAAGLVDTLKAAGPYTVFAPTDAAFKKLPPGTIEALLKDQAKLRSILEYHVVMGKIMAKDVTTRDTKSVQGGMLKFANTAGVVTVDDAKVVQSDIEASNGVIHGIDTIVMPK